MKIYSMTATFGKLENQTLTLEPGLNVISAPNEWGKSTWCAFLATMLYGLDTREKTTKTTLAVKERYAPWSGSPMSGRMDLCWNGRDITIERWTKGRTPFGEFKAYETASGLEVTELNGANCGEKLLGVEKSVFLRAGFLRLSDLPVTADDALRRRLNALVTTGDESGAADELAQKLKDLKNKCRYNRSGLLPQAEEQKKTLENKLAELQSLQQQSRRLKEELEAMDRQITQLHNHKTALEYKASEENRYRVAAAEEAARQVAQRLGELEEKARALPSRDTALEKLQALQDLQQRQFRAREGAQMLPQPPQKPGAPMCFYNLDPKQAMERVQADMAEYGALSAMPAKPFPLWIPGLVAAVLGILLLIWKLWIPGAILMAMGVGLFVAFGMRVGQHNRAAAERLAKAQTIRSRYGGGDPDDWLAEAAAYAQQQTDYAAALARYEAQRQQALAEITGLDQAIREATDGMGIPAATERWSSVLRQHDLLPDARREHGQAQAHLEALRSVAKPVERPLLPDTLEFSPEKTDQLLSEAMLEKNRLQLRLGQYQGRMEALGSESALQTLLDGVNGRIDRLNLTYNALDLALRTLEKATAELQRRFAPRIAASAREIFSRLTGGRYDRLNLTQELSVHTAAAEEATIRAAQWRSEGTVDQLYLALRLAVARELTSQAPLILDDALVRFDNVRHAAAMEILREEAVGKQVILFTCQSRELS